MLSADSNRCTTRTVLDDFTIWCQHELFTPTMVRAAALLECACDLHLAQLYRSLDLARHLETPKTDLFIFD